MRFIPFSPLLIHILFISSLPALSEKDGYSIPEEEGVDFDEGMG